MMRNLIAGAFVTLDGVVQDPGGFGELERGGWALEYFDETARDRATNALLASETFLLGRATFEILEKAWSGNSGPYAEAMHEIPKLVVSRTLRGPLPWNATPSSVTRRRRSRSSRKSPAGTSSCTAASR